jgi:hypothetical protein
VDKLLYIITVLLLFNFRPAIIGEIHVEILIFVLCFIILIYLAKKGNKIKLSKPQLNQIFIIIILILYLLIQPFVLQTSNYRPVISSFVILLIYIIIFIFILADKFKDYYYVKLFLKVFIYLVLFFSISQVITYLLIIFLPELKLIYKEIQNYQSGFVKGYANLYIPFTIAGANVQNVFGIIFPRSMGIFREPGIYQMYINIAYFSLDFIDVNNKKIIKLILIFSLLSTFSTAGFGIFFVCYIYKYTNRILGKDINLVQILFFILVTFIIGNFIFYSSNFGFFDKLDNVSGQTRSNAIISNIKWFLENPIFGTGHYNPGANTTAISLAASFHTIGLFGLLLYFFIWSYSIIINTNLKSVILYIPIFLTLLLSQPIFDNVIVFLFLMLNLKRLKYID